MLDLKYTQIKREREREREREGKESERQRKMTQHQITNFSTHKNNLRKPFCVVWERKNHKKKHNKRLKE